MHLICVVLFNLLLFNGCLTANINRESASDEVQQPESSGNVTQGSAFNEDFQYAIFDTAELEEILQFAKDPQCSDFVIKQIFPVKYHNYDVNIDADGNHPQAHVRQVANAVYISGRDFFMDIIKYFGKSIHKLQMFSTEMIDDDQSAVIHKHVNEYCSESLIYLFLSDVKEVILKQFQKPFSNLNELTLYLRTDRIGSFELFNETFPTLKQLHIKYFTPIQNIQPNVDRLIESDVAQMEHLEELTVSIHTNLIANHSDIAVIQEHLRNFFGKNPHIRRLIYAPDQYDDFIHVINEKLPNLEELGMWNVHPDIQPGQFNRVKRLIANAAEAMVAVKLTFPCLESIHLYNYEKIESENVSDLWRQFFENHQNIKQLEFTMNSGNVFKDFLSQLPNVEEVSIDSPGNFDIETISGFIETHENLIKLQYKSITQPDMAAYNEKYGNQWNISYNPKYRPTLTFEKIN